MNIDSPVVAVGIAGKQPNVLRFAARQARLSGAGLQVVHAAGPSELTTTFAPGIDVSDALQAEGQFVLDDAKQFVKEELEHADADFVLSEGRPIEALEDAASRACMLILGADDVPWYDRLLRTKISGHLALRTACPVIVVPESSSPESRGDVVVTLDGDSAATGPLRFAFEQASARDCTLHVIHAVPPVTMMWDIADLQANLSEVLAGWRQEYPDVDVEVSYGVGDPVEVVASITDQAELVVVGRPHRGTMPFAISRSVALEVLRRANCAVAVVPTDYRSA